MRDLLDTVRHQARTPLHICKQQEIASRACQAVAVMIRVTKFPVRFDRLREAITKRRTAQGWDYLRECRTTIQGRVLYIFYNCFTVDDLLVS